MISFVCTTCGRPLRVADQHAGNKAKCPGCATLVPIPAATAEAKQTVATPAKSIAPASADPTASAAGENNLVTVPGYEVVRELGRGGMGVIYLALQQEPRRFVALKMILAGEHAGPEQLARFRTEAEAAARLQHPNIITIHQVGEADGRPYLALEHIAGGSLAQHLKEHKLPPRQAAELLRQLARAVHFAHQRGILHRDLKPANVLLAPAPEGDDAALPWLPKLTDFGLAKQMEGIASVVAEGPKSSSGTILGTPGYMAPEQVQRQGQAVGPAADVYALGAILYELLTGQPPFQADNVLDTILLVATEEPAPPRRLNPQLSPDLETICLKCLHKRPEHRYGSARELAEDLRRFLAGEPIQARRAGGLGQAGRWLKRHKEIAYLAGGALLAGGLVILLTLPLLPWASPSANPEPGRDAETAPVKREKLTRDPKEPGMEDIAQIMMQVGGAMASQENLKRLALAMHSYHTVHGELPPPAIYHQGTGKPLLSWRVALLPYLGNAEVDLYRQFRLQESWESPHNKGLLGRMPAVYRALDGQPMSWERTHYQVFVGPGTCLEPTGKPGGPLGMKGRPLSEITDGPANTLLIVEGSKAVPWTSPQDLPYDPAGPLPPLGGLFKDRVHAAFADGSTAAIKADLPVASWRALITRNGGEPPPQGWQVEQGLPFAPAAVVVGEVHCQKQPLSGGKLVFHSIGRDTPAGGVETEIRKDGKYALNWLPPGDHRVTVTGPPGLAPAVPVAYTRPETTPLRVTVRPGINNIDLLVK
jgi:hypothetical protein